MTKSSRARRATALAATVAVFCVPGAAVSAAPSRPVQVVSSAPKMSKLTPALGDIAGGTVVEILGTGLLNTTGVTFGGVPSDRVIPLSDTRLIVVAPAVPAGTVPLVVTTDDGTVTAKFGFRMSLGAEFDAVTTGAAGNVRFRVAVTGGTVGATAREFSTLKITAKVGGLTARVGYLDENTVEVTAPATTRAGAATVQLFQDGFGGPLSTSTVDYVPAVAGVTPARVSTEGGAIVRIAGSGFLGVDTSDPTAVTFGGVPATSFVVVSANRIDAEAPPSTDGVAAVRVSSSAGASLEAAKAQVAYRAPLAVDESGDLALKAGSTILLPVTGGTLGADAKEFATRAVSVLVGNTRLGASYVDPTHLRVTMPALTADSTTLRLVHDTVPGPLSTVAVAPVVTSLSVTSGPVAGGRQVTVKVAGPGSATATGFRFGDNPADCTPRGAGRTLIFLCTTPPATGAGPVQVSFTAGDRQSRFTAPAMFSYTDID